MAKKNNKPVCYRIYIGMTAKRPDGAVIQFTPAQIREVVADALAAKGLDGCTFFAGQGLWKGEGEASTIVELVATVGNHAKVRELCADVKYQLSQEAVLHTVSELRLAEVA